MQGTHRRGALAWPPQAYEPSRQRLITKEIAMNSSKKMQLVGIVQRTVGGEKKNYWNRIGAAFENRDGSWNLRFDYLPTGASETTIQMRPSTLR